MTTTPNFPALYLSAPHDCPYLPGEESSSLLLDPHTKVGDQVFSSAIESGFRRSGEMVYRPHCRNCTACQSVKIPTQLFKITRSQKRVARTNNDITVLFVEPIYDERHFKLYCRYQKWKHQGDSMDHSNKERYEESMVKSSVRTAMAEFWLGDQLIAVSVVDVVSMGLSAVYTFFDPDYANRSLGTFAVLTLVEKAKELALDYVYLGYWIKNCQKMDYKSNFKPLYIYTDSEWVDFETGDLVV
ncbi:MAG: arginyl-tRNA--protein-N-Asp/Glu arginylyltransferase [Saprospiraceae bacterium]|jgi:arginyl-tRNA--protein-N-Asp/Glu arginylyltransferase